jgi:phosphate transport system substrate-binding protein
LACAAAFAGCALTPATAAARPNVSSGAGATSYTIAGIGSTLIAPLEAEWASAWDNASHNTVTYNSAGSGPGYTAIANGQADFGASDAPLGSYNNTPPCTSCVQIPWGLTAVGVSFHINGIHSLHLTGPVLANIYLGKITNWDNSAIKKLNPKTKLPSLPIQVFYRSGGSGDSYAFTCYLSDVSTSFKNKVGCTTTYPTSGVPGTAESGNSGMAAAVQANNGGIAYVAVAYLANDGLPAAGIKNRGGNFEVPNLNQIEAAAAVVHHVPSNNQVTILNPPKSAKNAYPISTFTYVIVPTNGGSRFGGAPGSVIKQFIYYALHGGQQFAAALDFAHLPKVVLNAATNTLKQISNS